MCQIIIIRQISLDSQPFVPEAIQPLPAFRTPYAFANVRERCQFRHPVTQSRLGAVAANSTRLPRSAPRTAVSAVRFFQHAEQFCEIFPESCCQSRRCRYMPSMNTQLASFFVRMLICGFFIVTALAIIAYLNYLSYNIGFAEGLEHGSLNLPTP